MLIANINLKAGESINGYFLRVAEANGMAHIRHFLAPFNIKPRVSYGKEQLVRMAAELSLNADDLVRANPTMGAMIPSKNARFIPVGRSAVCPHCLAEEGFLRAAWDNVLVTSCVKHGNLLVDRCPACEMPLTLERASVGFCDCGQHLSKIKTTQADPFLVALSAKLQGVTAEELEMLPLGMREQQPDELDGFLWYLHCYADESNATDSMTRPYPVETNDAVRMMLGNIKAVLTNWPDGFHRLMTALESKSDGDSAGLSKQLGHWYRMLYTKYGTDHFQWMHDAFAQYVTEHFAGTLNDRTSRIPRGLTQIKGWISIAEAKNILGVQSQRIRVALDAGSLEGVVRSSGAQRDFCFIKRAEIECIKAARESYWSAREVQRRLEITKTQMERLIEAGAFNRHAENQRPPLVDDEFLGSEVQAFMSTLESRVMNRPLDPARSRHLGDVVVTRAANAQQVLQIYQSVVRGELKPCSINPEVMGLHRFVFDADEIDEICSVNLGGTTITMTQLCEISGWKADVVAQWVRSSHLKAKHVPNGAKKATLIRIDDLIKFMQSFVVMADVASAAGTSSRHLDRNLSSKGASTISFENSDGVRFGLLLPMPELSKAITANAVLSRKSA